MKSGDIHGLRALVTGGTKGIGAAVVETLNAKGVQVITTAHSADCLNRCSIFD